MAVPLRQIPANLLVPGQYQEIDNSLAGAQGTSRRHWLSVFACQTDRRRLGFR